MGLIVHVCVCTCACAESGGAGETGKRMEDAKKNPKLYSHQHSSGNYL